jgi:transcriptional regulator with XRE-family HTH domain
VRSSDSHAVAPQDVAAVGQILFGSGWRSELARVLGVSENEIVQVECGLASAPDDWRGKLIALAQDFAVRALEAANTLLSSVQGSAESALRPKPPLFA